MAQIIQTRFVLRNDSNENWTLVADTAILLKGEPAIEFIDGSAPKMKIGDGEHTWAELPYVSGEGGTATLPEKFRWGDLTGAVGTDTTATTTNLELTKPASGDVVSVHTLNQNADKLDTAYENLNTKIKVNSNQVSELVNNFTENASYDAAEVIDIRAGYDGETYQSAGDAVRQIGYNLKDLQDNLGDFVNAEMVNGLMYEDSKLYLTSNGVVIGDPVTITGGSGTGGGGSSYSISLTNLMDSRVLSYAKGETITLRFRYTSIDSENYNDGAGICTISVGGLQKAVISANQGNNEVDITNYVADGANQVKVTVENSEGNKKTLAYTVNVLALAVTTTLSNMSMYTGNVAVPYIVTGAGQKTVYFQLDNDLLGKEVIETSGRSRVFNLNDVADGAHVLKIWAEVENQGSKVHSNTLYLGMMFHSETMTDQAVLINYQGTEITQGDTLSIPYMVYDPFAEDVEIHLNIYNSDKTLYSSKHLTIDHTPKTWVTQDFPIGEKIKFEIVCGNSDNSITLKVNESDFKQTIIKDSMELEFTAANRSNAEDNPGEWHYNDVVATFSGFGWEGADGWVEDEDGQTVLRFLPDDTMFIPFKPFATDFRGNGYTIEAEIATHNVRDYDSIVVESLNKGTGFQIKSQQASLSSEQSKVNIQFKEDSKVRITFVVEQQNLNRFIYVYINGVMCGVTQYPESDNFKQVEPVGITIGAESCGLDLYVLRFYSKGLTRHEQLNNFICDRPTLAARKEAYERNNVLDSNDQVALASLPLSIPYMILECEELPQYKGDKKKEKSLTYVEPLHPERSFTATGVQFNVQGTSSQGYPVKNYKADCKKGIDYTLSGEHAKGWPINVGDLETTCFCLKADFASSENANNTCLAGYYDELVPYKTPAQEADDRVQTTVRGNPIVVFWRNTETNDIKFLGKYNINVDKSNENIFGFNREIYPALECWEFLNNTSNRTLFKSADFTSTNADGEPAWLDDFEARFPDLDEPYQDCTALKRFAEWLVSTDRDAEGLTEEEKTARLQKFKDEYSQYMTLTPYIYYYLFTEVFLMVDSRAKNLFLTTWDGVHWEPFCYDLDTANGINNEGALVFGYDLEDTDLVDGAQVFNGQKSTLWCNIRDAFPAEIKAMYQELRSSGKFSYEAINTKMANHQAMWPEAIWNEDAYNKYLDPYLTKNENYLDMLQGDKKSQRDWWLFNTFRYRDSKYQCGDAQSNFITLRCYDTNSITVTPYSNIWPRIKFGSSTVTCRGKRNESYTFECPLDQMNDTEVYIYSADRIANIGDLSPLNVGLANFSMATKLQNIILGSSTEGYQNTQLTDLNVGNNELLTLLNVENCIKLTKPVDMSGCHGLETVLAKGTALTGINLPNGGHLKTLELPATIANLKIQNQKNIEKLSLEGQQALTTLYIENTPNLDLENLINNSPNLNRARLIGVEWTATSEDTLRTSIEILKKCSGLDATGQTVSKAALSGRVHVPSITNEFLEEINDIFPELVVVVKGVAKFFVKFLNYDNTLLYRYICEEGQEITDPIEAGIIEQPTRENTATGQFTWLGWSEQLPITAANKAYNIIAKFYSIYLAQFVNDTGESVYETWVEEGKNVEDPVAAGRISAPTREQTVQYKYEFKGWDKPLTEIMAATIFKPTFNEVLRSYEVFFYVDNRELQKTLVLYGDTAQYQGDVSLIKKIINGEESPYFEFQGWSPDPSEPITGSKYYYAQFAFNGYIEDDWATIAANCAAGNIDAYGYGGRKKMTLTIGNDTEEFELEIVGKNHDTLATTSESYNNGATTAGLSFLIYEIPNNTFSFNYHTMNNDRKKDPDTDNECLNAGGWRISDLREYMNSTLYAALPAELKNVIKPVVKKSDGGYFSPKLYTSTDKLWLPSDRELNGEVSGQVTLGQGEPYAMFTNANSRVKGKKNYWTRSTGIMGQNFFRYVDTNGLIAVAGASAGRYLAWGFCI